MPKPNHLFTVTAWLLKAMSLIALGVVCLLVLVLGGVLLAQMGVFHIPVPANEMHGLVMDVALRGVALVLVAAVVCIVMLALVLFLTSRIVDSATVGDPFVDTNATRLNRIGFLLLAMQGVGLATHTMIARMPAELHGHLNFSFDASPSGLFAVLLVFVLAQIFRRGSEMRAELEGTI